MSARTPMHPFHLAFCYPGTAAKGGMISAGVT